MSGNHHNFFEHYDYSDYPETETELEPTTETGIIHSFMRKMEETLDDFSARSGFHRPYPPMSVHYHHPQPQPHQTHHQSYHQPPHHPMMTTTLLSFLPALFGLGAFIYVNQDTTTASTSSAPTVTVNVNTTATATNTNSGNGNGNGNNVTSILPVFVFPNGTLAIPLVTPLLGLTGLTGFTGITLGLANLLGLINVGRSLDDGIPLPDPFFSSSDKARFIDEDDEDFVTMHWHEIEFNKLLADLTSLGK